MGWVAVMLPRSSGAMTPRRPPMRRTTRSSRSTSTGSPACTTRPGPARTERRKQRRPRSEVRPADVHRAHHDLAALGRALHHRVVDRDRPLDRLVGVLESGGRPGHRPERLEEPGVAAERGADGRRRRHRKMPAFQATPSCVASSLGPGRLGLLLEPEQRVGADGRPADVLATAEVRDEVAVLGRRPVDLDAERDERVRRCRTTPVARCSAAVRRTSRKRRRVSTVWSAGRTTMTSSSGDRWRASRGRWPPRCCARAARRPARRRGPAP